MNAVRVMSLAALAGLAISCRSASAADSARSGEAPIASSASQISIARFHVDGMACERCSERLREGLRKLDGVIDADADHQKKEVIVRYDPGRISAERLRREIERLGFDVTS